jgi:uncharacterized RDD family membrane protein YckC
LTGVKTNTLLIQTPEGIVFSQQLAGPLTRFLAWAVDLGCMMAVMSILESLLGIFGIISLDVALALTVLSYFLVSIGYGILLEWYWRGQTVGKRVVRLRVADAEGLKLQFSQIVIRNLLRFVDSLPIFYLVGGIACLASRRSQRLGDFAANTVVIQIPRIAEPDLDQLAGDKYNSLRSYPHLEARLKQAVSPGEASLALQALLRRNELDAQRRLELFHGIANHFRSKVEFPTEATDGIGDEQYVRNVVEILFRSTVKGAWKKDDKATPTIETRRA